MQVEETDITSDERNMAVIAHALSFVEGGIIGPLLIYILKKDESRFIAFHAWQSFLWGVGFVVSMFVLGMGLVVVVLSTAVSGSGGPPVALFIAPLFLLATIAYFVFEVIACFRAYRGEWYELPIVGGYARRRHAP